MKSFSQFQEQINQILDRKEKKELDKKANLQYIKKQITAASKHRTHVHNELSKKSNLEKAEKEFSSVS
jgi:hypothetical protein